MIQVLGLAGMRHEELRGYFEKARGMLGRRRGMNVG